MENQVSVHFQSISDSFKIETVGLDEGSYIIISGIQRVDTTQLTQVHVIRDIQKCVLLKSCGAECNVGADVCYSLSVLSVASGILIP